mgnify:FL=1
MAPQKLGLFYSLVDIVFIGGSLVRHGGQNIAEAARLGCAITCGPHMFNFTGITERLTKADALTTVCNAKELANEVCLLLSNKDLVRRRAEIGMKIVEIDTETAQQMLKDIVNIFRLYLRLDKQ